MENQKDEQVFSGITKSSATEFEFTVAFYEGRDVTFLEVRATVRNEFSVKSGSARRHYDRVSKRGLIHLDLREFLMDWLDQQ